MSEPADVTAEVMKCLRKGGSFLNSLYKVSWIVLEHDVDTRVAFQLVGLVAEMNMVLRMMGATDSQDAMLTHRDQPTSPEDEIERAGRGG